MSHFVREHWYVASWGSEIGDKPLGRRLLGDPVVLFRQADKTVAPRRDRCPQRLVPRALGGCREGRIQCLYHGMQFDGTGRCVHIPAQETIPPQAKTQAYPVVERFGLVWVWMGDPARADTALIPVIEKYGAPGWEVMSDGYQHHPSSYLNIIENLMDPSHTTFLHANTIGNPLAGEKPVTTEKHDGYIVAYRWMENSEPTAHDRRRINIGDIKVDRGQYFYFYLPSMSRVETVVVPAGTERTEESLSSHGMRTYSYKFLTPETDATTHFFWIHVRNYQVGNEQAAINLRAALEQTFAEDLQIELAMQRAQEETGQRQLVGLEIDRAPSLAVRMLKRMIESEAPHQTPRAAALA